MAAKQGKVMGSAAYYGYTKDKNKYLIPFDEEVGIVKEIFDYFVVKKKTPQEIAFILRDRKVLSPDASAVTYAKRKAQ